MVLDHNYENGMIKEHYVTKKSRRSIGRVTEKGGWGDLGRNSFITKSSLRF